MNIQTLVQKQREYFYTYETFDITFRIQTLKKLYQAIQTYEDEIAEALQKDLGKSAYESYMCEIGLSLSEISYMLKHITKFTKVRRVATPMSQFAATSYQKPSPYGNVLIMCPWNYPFLLAIEPLANALAAGNTAIIKTSEFSPNINRVLKKMIENYFKPELIAVVEGGKIENQALLNEKFDFVFFTGSQKVGKIVLQQMASKLTPVVLELGGKSPCIVDASANLTLAAKRIVFGKFLNCGQTCVAPDFILCDKKIKQQLIKELQKQIQVQYGTKPLQNSNYGKIISKEHFLRLKSLIALDKVVVGGCVNEDNLQIEPTILDCITWEDNIMQEEIFGPILPVLTFEQQKDVISLLKDKPKPLALYIFSEDKQQIHNLTTYLLFGGGCINDVIIHLATSEMGFGGVGESGMGAYHGKVGFDTFSHMKSIVDKKTWIDLPMRYQPYKKGLFESILRFFLK